MPSGLDKNGCFTGDSSLGGGLLEKEDSALDRPVQNSNEATSTGSGRRKKRANTLTIPESFDMRKHKKCGDFIGKVRSQNNCASCWAYAAAQLVSDTMCIGTSAKVEPIKQWVSPEHSM